MVRSKILAMLVLTSRFSVAISHSIRTLVGPSATSVYWLYNIAVGLQRCKTCPRVVLWVITAMNSD